VEKAVATEAEQPTARRRDASRNRDAVLTVFREAMQRGETVTMEEIAHRAGIGVATLYRHFPSRIELQRASYTTLIEDEIVPIVGVVDPDNPRGSFIEVGLRLIDLVQRNQVPGAPTLDLPAVVGELVAEFSDPLSELMLEGQRNGVIRPDIGFVDALWLLQMVATGFSVPSADDTVRRRYLSLVFDAISVGERSLLPPLET
jgi:AcrR family transcriptional regulator